MDRKMRQFLTYGILKDLGGESENK